MGNVTVWNKRHYACNSFIFVENNISKFLEPDFEKYTMNKFDDFFAAQKRAQTFEECFALAPMEMEEINIDYDRLRIPPHLSTQHIHSLNSFHDIFDKRDYSVCWPGGEALSALTMPALKGLDAAGHDMESLRYDIAYHTLWVRPEAPRDFHADANIDIHLGNHAATFLRNAKKTQIILSEILSTVTMNMPPVIERCPVNCDSALFYGFVVKALELPQRIFEVIVQESVSLPAEIDKQAFAAHVWEAAESLKAQTPDFHAAARPICFNHNVLHSTNGVLVDEPGPGVLKRPRIIMSIMPR